MADTNFHRPLKLMHGYTMDFFDFSSVGIVDYGEQCKIIEQGIDELINLGYGGIVTNICFDNYFGDDTAKKLLKHKIEYCKKRGIRVWIYDERGYPSGKAGGLTLQKNPDFEARGIVGIFGEAKPGESVSIAFPHGHEKVIAAYAYDGTCLDDIEIESAVPVATRANGDLDYENTSGGAKFVAYIVSKRLYEGTHAERNYDDARRYPDLMNRAAGAEFVSNTYEAYKEIAGEYFGDTIEAFFTDEPSCLAYYLPKLPAKVHDAIDETIPLLPVVNWTGDFRERFCELYGYEIDRYLPYVFGGNAPKAFDIREDYHNAVSKFYEEGFFAQIGDFCKKNNVAFSGHLLMEESLNLHTPFEGNFFHQLRHMDYPGIDMLTSIPESVFGAAQVPKLVASVACLNGKKHVMSEASGYVETIIGKQKLSFEQMAGACVLQYALGVDTFTSYYQRDIIDEPNYRLWNETLGRIDELMGEGTQKAKVLLYYPIETAHRNYVPQYGFDKSSEEYFKRHDFSFYNRSLAASASWGELSRCLLKNQIDYFMVDFETLQSAKIGEGKININENGNDFEVLVLPACDITDKLSELLKKLCEKNIKVIDVSAYESEGAMLEGLRASVKLDVSLKPRADIVYMKKEGESGTNYLFVNIRDIEAATTVELCIENRHNLYMYNPITDEKVPLEAKTDGDKATFGLNLPGYGFAIVMAN